MVDPKVDLMLKVAEELTALIRRELDERKTAHLYIALYRVQDAIKELNNHNMTVTGAGFAG
jgi:hypothetical protein